MKTVYVTYISSQTYTIKVPDDFVLDLDSAIELSIENPVDVDKQTDWELSSVKLNDREMYF